MGMGSFRVLGLFSIIPVTLLLALSYFVLFSVRKVEAQGLKNFGWVIAVLLWICGALVFSTGLFTIASGKHPMMGMMYKMHMMHMHECPGMEEEMKGAMPMEKMGKAEEKPAKKAK
jgi:hypothetical protein